MDKKVESRSSKKRYSKPQITRVKLAIRGATLGDCWTLNQAVANSSTCQTGACPGG